MIAKSTIIQCMHALLDTISLYAHERAASDGIFRKKQRSMVPECKRLSSLSKKDLKYMQNLPEYRIEHSKGVAKFFVFICKS